MDPFVRAMLGTIRRERLLVRGEAVLVGFSGGPDSTALLAALADAAFDVSALHVNHGLRGAESGRDEESARAVSKKLGVPFEVVRVAVHRRGGESPEDAARRAREAAFAAAAHGQAVATGHTRDDQAETVLYRAARGAGPRGLRGILPSRALESGARLVRPLLDLSRAEVLEYLRRRKLPFTFDSSNADPKFARNRIRSQVLPALEEARPGAAKHLAELARASGEIERWIESEAKSALERLKLPGGLDAAGLAALPPALRHAVVEMAGAGPLRASHRAALDRLFDRPPRRIAVLGGGWIANLRGGAVRLTPPARSADPETALHVPGECVMPSSGRKVTARVEGARLGFLGEFVKRKPALEEALDADRAPGPFLIGPPRRGERMRPLGAPGSRKIADILLDLGVPRAERHAELVARDAEDRAVWLVGRRVAEFAKVTAATKRVLRLKAAPPPTC